MVRNEDECYVTVTSLFFLLGGVVVSSTMYHIIRIVARHQQAWWSSTRTRRLFPEMFSVVLVVGRQGVWFLWLWIQQLLWLPLCISCCQETSCNNLALAVLSISSSNSSSYQQHHHLSPFQQQRKLHFFFISFSFGLFRAASIHFFLTQQHAAWGSAHLKHDYLEAIMHHQSTTTATIILG